MKITRSAALLAVILGGAVALSGCASTPSTPEGVAEAKTKELIAALQAGDQEKYDALFCDGKSGMLNIASFKDSGTSFELDPTTSPSDDIYTDGGAAYHVTFSVKDSPKGYTVMKTDVRTDGDGAPCVVGNSMDS